jgi:TRAP-type mannitol/chloroaromatic compound transport system permease small subunit
MLFRTSRSIGQNGTIAFTFHKVKEILIILLTFCSKAYSCVRFANNNTKKKLTKIWQYLFVQIHFLANKC